MGVVWYAIYRYSLRVYKHTHYKMNDMKNALHILFSKLYVLAKNK